jgi:hypothetical protein
LGEVSNSIISTRGATRLVGLVAIARLNDLLGLFAARQELDGFLS